MSAKHIETRILNIWPTYIYVAQMAYSSSKNVRISLETKVVFPPIWERSYKIWACINKAVFSTCANSCPLPLISFQVWWGHLDLTSWLLSRVDKETSLGLEIRQKTNIAKRKRNAQRTKRAEIYRRAGTRKKFKRLKCVAIGHGLVFIPIERSQLWLVVGPEGDALCRGVRAGTAQLLWGWC